MSTFLLITLLPQNVFHLNHILSVILRDHSVYGFKVTEKIQAEIDMNVMKTRQLSVTLNTYRSVIITGTNLTLATGPFSVKALPMTAGVYSMTSGDVPQDSTFTITLDLRDESTDIPIPDITWRVIHMRKKSK